MKISTENLLTATRQARIDMPVINRVDVKKSRKKYYCDDCDLPIKKGSSYTYLYGMPEAGEQPYALRICTPCQDAQDKLVSED